MTGNIFGFSIITGIGATIVMDIWGLFVKHILKIPGPSWALVGRWVSHFPKGTFRHNTILQTPPTPGETAIGWITHYVTGIVYAFVFIYFVELQWFNHPTFLAPMLFGIITVLAPFLIMQPCFGFGIAASKTPNPWKARLMSLLNHSSFGLGLYLSAEGLRILLN